MTDTPDPPGTDGPEPSAWGPWPAGLGPPGSGPPAYGPPGSGPPGYGPPVYGPPGSGPPGYGPPGYGPPGYGPPGHGHPGLGPHGDDVTGAAAPRPGIIPLRPLGLGDLYGGAVGYIRANPSSTLLPAFLVAVVVQVVQLVARALLHADVPPTSPAAVAASLGRAGEVTAVAVPFALLFGAALAAVMTVVVRGAVLGRRTSLGQAWRQAAPRLPGVLGVSLLLGLLGAIVAAVGITLAVVVGVAIGRVVGAVVAVVLGLGVLAVVIQLAILFSMALPAYVMEGIGVTAALARSRALVRGSWWSVFGVLALTGLAISAVGGVLGAAIGLITLVAGRAPGTVTAGTPPGLTLATAIVSVLLTTVTTPFSIGVVTLLYLDRRIRLERYDVELALLAAGR